MKVWKNPIIFALAIGLMFSGCRFVSLNEPEGGEFLVSVENEIIAVGNEMTIQPTGGTEPYSFSITQGDGAVSEAGVFTAPNSPGEATVEVSDSAGSFTELTIIINEAMSFDSNEIPEVRADSSSYDLGVSGGVPPYTYSVQSGTGSFSGSVFSSTEVSYGRVRVTDSVGNTLEKRIASLGDVHLRYQAEDVNANGDGNAAWNEGDRVDSWRPVVGSTIAQQLTANNRPTFRASDVNLGGKPVIEFSSAVSNGVANQCLDLTADHMTVNRATVFTVFNSNGDLAEPVYTDEAVDGLISIGAVTGFMSSISDSPGGVSQAIVTTADSSQGNYVVGAGFYFGDTNSPGMGTSVVAASNGASLTVNQPFANATYPSGNNPVIGNYASNCTHAWTLTGRVAEIIYYEITMNLDEYYAIACYLADYYGLSDDFDGTCPD